MNIDEILKLKSMIDKGGQANIESILSLINSLNNNPNNNSKTIHNDSNATTSNIHDIVKSLYI